MASVACPHHRTSWFRGTPGFRRTGTPTNLAAWLPLSDREEPRCSRGPSKLRTKIAVVLTSHTGLQVRQRAATLRRRLTATWTHLSVHDP
jgi:hypothetical protein